MGTEDRPGDEPSGRRRKGKFDPYERAGGSSKRFGPHGRTHPHRPGHAGQGMHSPASQGPTRSTSATADVQTRPAGRKTRLPPQAKPRHPLPRAPYAPEHPPFQRRSPVESTGLLNWSGRQDLNLRPRRPERRALPSCATPRKNGKPSQKLPPLTLSTFCATEFVVRIKSKMSPDFEEPQEGRPFSGP